MNEHTKTRIVGNLGLVRQSTEWSAIRQFFTAAATAEELPELEAFLIAELEQIVKIESEQAKQRVAR